MLHFIMKLHIIIYRLHIRINNVPEPLIWDIDLYSNDECPFLHIKGTYNL